MIIKYSHDLDEAVERKEKHFYTIVNVIFLSFRC